MLETIVFIMVVAGFLLMIFFGSIIEGHLDRSKIEDEIKRYSDSLKKERGSKDRK